MPSSHVDWRGTARGAAVRASCSTLAALALAGCGTIEPWERGTLAKPQMALSPLPQQGAARAHVQASREAGNAATAAQGGGCGCY